MSRRAGLLRRSLLGGVSAGRESCSAVAVSEGILNPCTGTEQTCAQGDSGHKSDNITRSYSWLPGPWHSTDSQGELLGSRWSCRCQHASGLCPADVLRGSRGAVGSSTAVLVEERSREQSSACPGLPPAVAVQAALLVRAAGQPGLWLQ